MTTPDCWRIELAGGTQSRSKTGRRPPPQAARGLDGVGLQPMDLFRGEHGAMLPKVGRRVVTSPSNTVARNCLRVRHCEGRYWAASRTSAP
jgi:hypothetical protein